MKQLAFSPEPSRTLQPEKKAGTLDPVTAEVIRNALVRIATEMSLTMLYTSRSPICNETRDYATTVLDPQCRLVAGSPGSPGLLIISRHTAAEIIRAFRFDLHDGDVCVSNDPYSRGSHCGDWCLTMPVFFQGKLVAVTAVEAHMIDSGGGGDVAGGFNPRATLTLEESCITPPLKLWERGRLRSDIMRWLVVNNRLPVWFRGDLGGMWASCEVARRGIVELCNRYGPEAVLQAQEYAIAYGEKLVRAELASWPDGVYEGVAYMNGDLQGTFDVPVKAIVTIKGDHLSIDLSGSAPQVKGPANCPYAVTAMWIYLTLAGCLPPSIPKNEGIWNSITLINPEGTVTNPREGAPCGYCTLHPGLDINEALTKALAQAIPHKIGALGWKLASPVVFGIDPRTGQLYGTTNLDMKAGAGGASYGVDGWGSQSWMGGMEFSGPEMAEVQYLHFVEEKELLPDTGGAGQWRGQPAFRNVKRMVDHPWSISALVWGERHPNAGYCGGRDGSPNELIVDYGSESPVKVPGGTGYVGSFPANHKICLVRGGGGGWGDPLKREASAVLEDVIDGYVSVEGARRDYGVMIDPERLEVDGEGTARVRGERREKPEGA